MAHGLEHLDQLKHIMRSIASSLLIISVIALTGCMSEEFLPAETTGTRNPEPSNASPTPSIPPTFGPVLAYEPTNENVLGTLNSQEGVNSIGPFSTDAPAIAVYLTCVGIGEIALLIPEVGEFPLFCDADPSAGAIKNVFDIRHVEGDFSVDVKGLMGQRWAVSVAETEQPERYCC